MSSVNWDPLSRQELTPFLSSRLHGTMRGEEVMHHLRARVGKSRCAVSSISMGPRTGWNRAPPLVSLDCDARKK